jgi:NTP pyrophosphatase (non-canonical NTP hydrolase)
MQANNFVELFNAQAAFQNTIEIKQGGNELVPTDNAHKMQYHLAAASVEIAEILQLDERWKNWKKNYRPFKKEEKTEEFADAMIFLMNGAMFSGISGEELFNKIQDKIQINYKRQQEGY